MAWTAEVVVGSWFARKNINSKLQPPRTGQFYRPCLPETRDGGSSRRKDECGGAAGWRGLGQIWGKPGICVPFPQVFDLIAGAARNLIVLISRPQAAKKCFPAEGRDKLLRPKAAKIETLRPKAAKVYISRPKAAETETLRLKAATF